MQSRERLTAGDRLMLWPDERWPQDMSALAVLDGSGLLDPDRHAIADAIAGVATPGRVS